MNVPSKLGYFVLLFLCTFLLATISLSPVVAHADEPYARSRDYDLQHVRTHLWFDTDRRAIRGEVTHNISLLRDNISEIKFDSVNLKIQSATLDGKDAKFSVTSNQVILSLAAPGKSGDQHEIFIRYEGQPKKGLYFVLPDKNYPQRPKEIWSQGEAEDTRYYIPIYDYPNDRTTSEMLLTVPSSWITVSNGQIVSIKDEPDGTKTWTWNQSQPLSTYLISVVAGEFTEKTDEWRGITLRYVTPRGQEYKIDSTFARTKQMLDLFSNKLGVPYPWAQYAQSSVDEFVEGGMENTSATTLEARSLVNPQLVSETREGSDDLYSHELAHQWFGDLVTCKDWSNLWLNEGFATYFEHYWNEQHYGPDDAAYEFWRDQTQWFRQTRLFSVPIATRNFTDSVEYADNVYTKAGWALKMLREKLGDEDFFRALHYYLEINRGKNVVAADLEKATEESTSVNVDRFFQQWIYRAGAPEFKVSYTYDDDTHEVKISADQTQKIEGLVQIFDVPVDIEIATSKERKIYKIEVSDAKQTFTLPADSTPLMVLFDAGGKILKTLDFQKSPETLIYQVKNAETVPDRADAAVALGKIKNDNAVIAALGDAAQHDPFWGVRNEALRALGAIGGANAEKQVLTALETPSNTAEGSSKNDSPWVREMAVSQLSNFKDDGSLAPRLTDIAKNDKVFHIRAAALGSLAEIKAPDAFDTLAAMVKSDSPDDIVRKAALRGLGTLGDNRAVPILLDWAAPGKPFDSRGAAITAVAKLQENNKKITQKLISYLHEPYFDVSFAALFALGERGDSSAIGPLEELQKNGNLSFGLAPYVEMELAILKGHGNHASGAAPGVQGSNANPAENGQDTVIDRLKRLQEEMDQVNTRLADIESQLAKKKK